MAGRGLRTVSIGYKKVNQRDLVGQSQARNSKGVKDVIEEIEKSGFTLMGVFGIEDPPRE